MPVAAQNLNLKNLFDKVDMLVLFGDSAGYLSFANQTACNYLGIKKQHMGTLAFEEIILAPPVSLIREALDNKQFLLVSLNGQTFYTRGYCMPVVDAANEQKQNGLFVCVRYLGEDLPPEIRREELQSLVENISDGIMVLSDSLEILYTNRRSEELFGLSRTTMNGNPLSEIIPELAETSLISQFQYFESEDVTISNRTSEDSCILRASLSPVRAGADETLGLAITLQDVTRARELDELKDFFIANVSHEMRAPLASIKGFTRTLIKRDALPAAKREDYLDIIDRETDRLTRIIEDLLSISRIESGRQELQLATFPLAPFLDRITEVLSAQIAKKQITIHKKCAPTDLEGYGDENQILQVMINLVSNSIKFSPEQSSITLSARPVASGHFLQLAVTDEGCGIPETEQEHIFEKFYRVQKQSHRAAGTGLGLAIVKNIITLHQGRIYLESVPEEGTTFFVELPLPVGG